MSLKFNSFERQQDGSDGIGVGGIGAEMPIDATSPEDIGYKVAIEARISTGMKPAEVLRKLAEGELDKDHLKHLMSMRYQVSNFFEPLLERLLAAVKEKLPHKTQLVTALESNLEEEKGEGAQASPDDFGTTVHDDDRHRLLKSLGLDPKPWKAKLGSLNELGEEMHPVAKIFVARMRDLIDSDPIAAYAAFAFWESRASIPGVGDYVYLLKAFETFCPEFKKENGYRKGDPLFHIASHAQHDVTHADNFISALTVDAGAKGEQKSTMDGIDFAVASWNEFWDGMLHAVENN